MFPKLSKVQYIADPDRLVLTPTLRRDLVKGWISRMVTKAKESPIAQWASPVLLTIILGYVVYDGQTTKTDIRDLKTSVTILQTQKSEQDRTIERERQEKFQLTREQEAYRNRMEKEMLELRLVTQGKIPKSILDGNN